MSKEALMKNLEDLDKEEVAVIHSAFGDKPDVVAFVMVDKTFFAHLKNVTVFIPLPSRSDADFHFPVL